MSNEEQWEKNIQRAPENRQKRGHQQREANHKGSEKEEEVISNAKTEKNSNFFH